MPEELDPRLKEQREAQEQLERCYQRTFSTDDGQAVFKDLQKICFTEESTYIPGCTDAMLINEGLRRTFLHIVKMVRMDVTEMYLNRATPGKKKKKRIPRVEIDKNGHAPAHK